MDGSHPRSSALWSGQLGARLGPPDADKPGHSATAGFVERSDLSAGILADDGILDPDLAYSLQYICTTVQGLQSAIVWRCCEARLDLGC